MKLPANTHLGNAHLRVADLDRALLFYKQTLGFRLRERAGRSAFLSATGTEPDLLRLTEQPGAKPRPRRTTGLFHVAIRLPNRQALGITLLRLLARQVKLGGFADHGVSEAIYLADPDENGIELYADRPRESWPHHGDQIAMISDPLDVDALIALAQGAGGSGNGMDPATDIGHIHLQVSDLKKAEEFYADKLGFDVTQRSYPGALFFAAGGYHHHIGTNVWAGRGAPPPPADALGLISFSIMVPSQERSETQVIHDPDGHEIEIVHIS